VFRPSPVDEAARIHDLAYRAAEDQPNEAILKLHADVTLLQTIAGVDWSNLNGSESAYASMMAVAFGLKIATVDVVDVTIQAIQDAAHTAQQQIFSQGGDPEGKSYTDANG